MTVDNLLAADVITAYSSDGALAGADIVLLTDDRGALPAYDALLLVAPVVRLLAEGCGRMILAGRGVAKGEAVAAQLRAGGADVRFLPADMGRPDEAIALIDRGLGDQITPSNTITSTSTPTSTLPWSCASTIRPRPK